MTDIGVHVQNLLSDDNTWDLTKPQMGADVSGTVAVAAFTQAQHYVNGFIPSGTVLAKATGGTYSGFLVPYLDAGSNGAATAVGILKAPLQVIRQDGSVKDKVGAAMRVAFADVDTTKLPFTSSSAAAGGYLDADAKTDLKLINFR
jgi:hypothetical protein